jgi:erythronate-4-phosphate dehydrogenase
MNKIKIVADNKIPFLKGILEPYADIHYYNPSEITKDIIKEADALIIRTRTICNKELLEGSRVKFIATATIGYDHIDTEYCGKNNISWINAPGCNSSSVMQYIASALVTIAEKKGINLSNSTIGVIGVGNVGSKVAKLCKILGMKVLLNDPPRMRKEGKSEFVGIDDLISESEVISFHVPLIKEGIDKTYHLFEDSFISKIKSGKIIINSSRGPVVKSLALKTAIMNKVVIGSVIDVWENEPFIDKELLNLVDIATPHIAGYSADGKANGTAVCIRGINSFFNLGLKDNWYPEKIPVISDPNEITIDCKRKTKQQILNDIILYTYDIKKDDASLRESINTFEEQRSNYPIRREFPFYKINFSNCCQDIFPTVISLGFQVK